MIYSIKRQKNSSVIYKFTSIFLMAMIFIAFAFAGTSIYSSAKQYRNVKIGNMERSLQSALIIGLLCFSPIHIRTLCCWKNFLYLPTTLPYAAVIFYFMRIVKNCTPTVKTYPIFRSIWLSWGYPPRRLFHYMRL